MPTLAAARHTNAIANATAVAPSPSPPPPPSPATTTATTIVTTTTTAMVAAAAEMAANSGGGGTGLITTATNNNNNATVTTTTTAAAAATNESNHFLGSGSGDGGGGGGSGGESVDDAAAPSSTTATSLHPVHIHHNHHNHQQHQQQQLQQQQQQLVAIATSAHGGGGVVVAAAAAAATTCLTTFNGNTNFNGGHTDKYSNNNNNNNSNINLNGNCNNNNSNKKLQAPIMPTSRTTTTTTTATPVTATTATAIATTTTPTTTTTTQLTTNMLSAIATATQSREDIASLGGDSSVHSQISSTTNSNSNNNININNGNTIHINHQHNNNNNNNNMQMNIKGNKENSQQQQQQQPQQHHNGISNDDPGDGLGPLPPKWETAYTERGELYFIDHNTGTSHWLDPRLSKFQKKSLEDCGDDELPYGWEKIEDSLYGTYYIDHVNRRTQYENPVLEAKRRAAEQRQQLNCGSNKLLTNGNSSSSNNNNSVDGLDGVGLSGGIGALPTGLIGVGGVRLGCSANSASTVSLNSTLDINMQQRAPVPVPINPPPPPPPLANINNQQQQQLQLQQQQQSKTLLPYKFTRNPADMQGERIATTLVKSARGLGITIVGGDDGIEEFLQIKSIVPHGPAWLDGQLQMGDVLVYVNDTCVLGFTHHEMVQVFQSILPGERVILEVCRGYSLPFDPNDPNTEVVTTIAVDGITSTGATGSADSVEQQRRQLLMDLQLDAATQTAVTAASANSLATNHHNNINNNNSISNNNSNQSNITNNSGFIMKKPEVLTLSIQKGAMGFGFTIADSSFGQKVKKILDRNCCTQLLEGDLLLEINGQSVRQRSHLEVVQILKDCSATMATLVKIQRGANNTTNTTNNNSSNSSTSPKANNSSSGIQLTKLRKGIFGGGGGGGGNSTSIGLGLYRSKTPTADLYSTQQKEVLPMRPKTPLVDTRRARVKTPNSELLLQHQHQQQQQQQREDAEVAATIGNGGVVSAKSTGSLQDEALLDAANIPPYLDPYPKLVSSLSERLAEATTLHAGDMRSGSAMGMPTTQTSAAVAATMPRHLSALHQQQQQQQQDYATAGGILSDTLSSNYNSSIYGMATMPPTMSPLNPLQHHHLHQQQQQQQQQQQHQHLHQPHQLLQTQHQHHESCYCYDCQDYRNGLGIASVGGAIGGGAGGAASKYRLQPMSSVYHNSPPIVGPLMTTTASGALGMAPNTASQYSPLQAAHIQNERMQKRVNELLNDRRKLAVGVAYAPLDATASTCLQSLQQQQYHQQQQQQHLLQQQQQPSPAVSSISQVHWTGGVGGGGSGNAGVYATSLRNGSNALYGLLDDVNLNNANNALLASETPQYELSEVTLERQALGFGFRIVGGTEEGSQVTVGHIVPGGAADHDQRINTGDEILSIDGINVLNASHHKVVSLMGEAGLRGQVTMILRRRITRQMQPLQQQQQYQQPAHQQLAMRSPNTLLQRYPYDVIVSRQEHEGFGFVIISSSNQYYGSTIGKLIPGSPADRCGDLKVGDRIVAVNRIDIAGMSHGEVVNLIKESGLHVRLTIGCPRELSAATVTATALNAAAGATLGGILGNSTQASPGQLSMQHQTQQLLQTPPLLLQQQQQQQQQQPSPLLQQQQHVTHLLNEAPMYFERPSGTITSTAAAAATTTSTTNTNLLTTNLYQQQQQQQQKQQLQQQQHHQQLPPQL